MGMLNKHHTPVSNEMISDLSSAVSLTIPAGANAAWVQAQAQVVRYWLDGSTPTSSAGLMLAVGDMIEIEQDQLAGFRAIEQTSGAVLAVAYFKD
jgi:hypothetical protein